MFNPSTLQRTFSVVAYGAGLRVCFFRSIHGGCGKKSGHRCELPFLEEELSVGLQSMVGS